MKVFQCHPTLFCNRDCTWCPYQDKDNVEIPFETLKTQLLAHVQPGSELKLSGGGEPLFYSHWRELLCFSTAIGYTVYLQTNGDLLDNFTREYCKDIRISFGDGVPFSPPYIRPDGFSYVVSSAPDYDNLSELVRYASKYDIYVRITQDDTNIEHIPTIEEIIERLKVEPSLIKSGVSETERLHGNGLIRFWDALDYHKGKNPCPCYASPLYTPLGWLPCCKTHVAKELTPGYNLDMVLGWTFPQTPYDGSGCTRCYY